MPIDDYKLTFHINNLSYTIDIGSSELRDKLKAEILSSLPTNKHIDIKTLLLLYIQKSAEIVEHNNEVNQVISKIENAKI